MIKIIPAIDIIGGKCVRLSQGNYALKTVYADSPVEVAKWFEGCGIKRLHVVDLDGARIGKITNLHSLYAIASQTSLTLDFGGGIKTSEDVRSVLDNGAQMINVGSVAYKNKELLLDWAATYGWDKIFLGADVKDKKIMVNGWQEQTDRDITDHLQPFYANGMRQFFCTDVSRDGMLQGPGIELYKQILAVYPDIQLTASGGVSTIADIDNLAASGCAGVIVGKALYEGRIQMVDLKKYNN